MARMKVCYCVPAASLTLSYIYYLVKHPMGSIRLFATDNTVGELRWCEIFVNRGPVFDANRQKFCST